MPAMDRSVLLEGLGYLASVLVAISLMMRSIIRLRWINLVGAACFTVYGILIEAYPVAALNFAIVIINVWFLVRTHRTREAFSVLEMARDDPYVAQFLAFHSGDIHRFQPGFDGAAPGTRMLVVLRDMVPAGMLALAPRADGSAAIQLDYVTPAYRDLRVGRYLFHGRRDLFAAMGIRRVETAAGNPEHAKYLEKMGFRPAGAVYALDVAAA
jgi:GNAT superfamily N-acetyltransferase